MRRKVNDQTRQLHPIADLIYNSYTYEDPEKAEAEPMMARVAAAENFMVSKDISTTELDCDHSAKT